MPRRKAVSNNTTGLKNHLTGIIYNQFKLGESYVSLMLGVIVVVIAAVLVVSFAQNIKPKGVSLTQDTLSQKTEKTQEDAVKSGTAKTYTVVEGEDLWDISEKVYKSGYYWVEIAKANNLVDPNVIHKDNVLKLPDIKTVGTLASSDQVQIQTETTSVENAVTQPNSITGATYTVQSGDFLWDIAVRAYGDGYRWTEIAKANSLSDPDTIFSGNTLKIPR